MADQAKEERSFVELFDRIIRIIMDRDDITESSVAGALREILDDFKRHKFSDMSSRMDKVCAYVFRYGPHGAGLVRHRVLQAADVCEELDDCLKLSTGLSVVSLGGGPGNDAVGLCSALQKLGFRGRLDITVVDRLPEWSRSVNLLKDVVTENDYGSVSRLFRRNPVQVSFLPAGVASVLCYPALKKANIVLAAKVFAILDAVTRRMAIEALHKCMNDDALLLVIDSPFHRTLWEPKFEILYNSGNDPSRYQSSAGRRRFGHDAKVSSKAEIVVLRKNPDSSSSSESSSDESEPCRLRLPIPEPILRLPMPLPVRSPIRLFGPQNDSDIGSTMAAEAVSTAAIFALGALTGAPIPKI